LFEDVSELTVRDANLKPFSAAAACVESVWVVSTVGVAWRRSVGDFVFRVGQTAPRWAKGLIIIQAYRSHLNTPHLLLLLWTRDRPVAEISMINTHQFTRDSHTHGGIRTRSPSKRTVADLRLRPHGLWMMKNVNHTFLLYTV
jgi:hypothetical protein